MKDPIISCIMSNYNTDPNMFRQSVESILNQTFRNFELILIDDHSANNESKNIVSEYAKIDDRIVPVFNRENMGLAGALNEGLKIATGKYIARFDTDDICCVDRFEKQIEYMEKVGADICSTFGHCFGASNSIVSTAFYDCRSVSAMLLFSCYIYHTPVMMKKSFLDKHNLYYDESYDKAEDFDLFTRCNDAGAKICIMPDVMFYYRIHTASACHTEKSRQVILSEIICKRQLDEKEICYTEDELELHYILCGLREFDPTIYQELCQWCDKLIDENGERKAYNSKVFKKVVYNRLLTAIAKADIPVAKKIKFVISDRRLCNATNIYSVLYKKLYALGYKLSGREKEWMRIVSGE